MKILKEFSEIPKQVSLILGFFDGIHAGHLRVLGQETAYPRLVITFKNSPAEYFNKNVNYILNREQNYKIIESLGIEYLLELDFSQYVNITAEEYLEFLHEKFSPKVIITGFNHTFGANRKGDSEFLKNNQEKYGYKYFCIPPTLIEDTIISSSYIKELLLHGELKKANDLLTRPFSIISTVIEGKKLGRELGFPTANLQYPQNIIKLPYGVYKVQVGDKLGVLNWGVKPTIGSEEMLEVHILDFCENLYNKEIEIKFLSKIREEKCFKNLEELKSQIKKDIDECLK